MFNKLIAFVSLFLFPLDKMRYRRTLTVLHNRCAYITAALEGMFPGIAVSSRPAFTVITISRCLEEMKLHSQLEGQPLWEQIHRALSNCFHKLLLAHSNILCLKVPISSKFLFHAMNFCEKNFRFE